MQALELHYQSYILCDNYKSKETLWKNSEKYYHDNYTTPMIQQ